MSSDVATVISSYFFVMLAILTGVSYVAKYYVEKQTEALKEQLNKIMYALYNDGKTGLINKVDQLIENQQCIRVDVEVMKAKINHE